MPFSLDLDLFPRKHPTLPQQDTSSEQHRRGEQLVKSQRKYQWTNTMSNVVGVPMATEVHFADEPTLAWLLLVSEVGLKIAENLLAVKLVNADETDEDDKAKTQSKLQQVHQRLQAVREIHANQAPNQDAGLIQTVITATKQLLKEHNLSFDELVSQFQDLAKDYTLANIGSPLEEGLAPYNQLFQTLTLPTLAKTFWDDETFARFRIAGPNPMLIKGINEIPAKFPLTDGQYRDVMGSEDSLTEALAEHRLYLLDYAELDYLAAEPGQTATGQSKYVYAPIALFAIAKGQTSLTPVAIQCGQNPEHFPLFFKVGKNQPLQWWGWQMAKTIVQVAEGNYHELFVHLARTHLVLEAFTVATHRCLAECHPLNVLLLPHFEGTLFINNAAAKQLIAEGGPIDHIFAAPIARTQQAAGSDRLNFDFYANMLPTELQSRQVANSAWLPDYPYRDDALLVWGAIERWVGDYVSVYYGSDAAVMGDTELAAWTASLMGEGKINGFKEITSRMQLISVLTMIIFTASAQHAAVNFPQKPLMTYAPALSGAAWQPAPAGQIDHSEKDWLQLLPPVQQSFEQLNVLYLLGSVHYRRLGDYRSNSFPYLPWFEDEQITKNGGPLAKFQQSLLTVESTINARNSERISYEFLLPSQIPNSINI